MNKKNPILATCVFPIRRFRDFSSVCIRFFLSFFCVILTFNAHAQSLDGVYMTSDEEALMVLRKKGNGYDGRFTDGKTIYKLQAVEKEGYLTITATGGKETETAYAAPDGNGNLVVTDSELNVYSFSRVSAAVDEVIARLDRPEALNKPVAQPAGNSSTAGGTTDGHIDSRYANRKFLHLYTGNGYTEKWAYYLFEDGRFVYRSSSSYLSSDAYYDFSAASQGNEAGRWAISRKGGAEYLELSWNDGNKGSLRIEKAQTGYLLNGTKYFLVGLNEYD